MPIREFLGRAEVAFNALVSGEVFPAAQLFPQDVVADLTFLIRAGIDPGKQPEVHPDCAGLKRRQKACLLYGWREEITSELIGNRSVNRMVVICDADAVVLARAGHEGMLRQAEGFGLVEGINWAGRQPATNAVRRSKLLRGPSQLVSAQHLRRDQHRVACTVSPVLGRNGCVGFIDLVSPAWDFNDEMESLVGLAAKLASSKADQSYRAGLRGLRAWARANVDLGRYGAGALVTDYRGWVACADRWDCDDRLLIPESGLCPGWHELEGLGRVILEPLYGGWLVRRPVPGESIPPVQVTLDLRLPRHDNEHAGRIEVRGPTVCWQHDLTRGKAEILLMLAKLGGRTYDELAGDLYPHTPTAGTIRSRWCRLRDTLGGLLASDNGCHMFARNVDIRPVRYPPNRADLLPGSTAPGVAADRGDGARGQEHR